MYMEGSFANSLTALGVGTGLLVYVYNKDLQKCSMAAKVTGYFIVIAAVIGLLFGAANCASACKSGSCGHSMCQRMHGGAGGECSKHGMGAGMMKDGKACCAKDGSMMDDGAMEKAK